MREPKIRLMCKEIAGRKRLKKEKLAVEFDRNFDLDFRFLEAILRTKRQQCSMRSQEQTEIQFEFDLFSFAFSIRLERLCSPLKTYTT